jgi:hypothetical protein
VDVLPDGSRDVTAPVAVDSVAAGVGAVLRRQRDVLRDLGLSAGRPDHDVADDPEGYLRRLVSAAGAAELAAEGGLGDFWWLVTTKG